ncbi:hypothetical protein [Thiocystis violacea]|uniref:hypothetical protein n=1 Tax=Thiocystis violacea TaxID=13725 RepID=UPI001905E501|nr:hypothetical protein [Thiocystis violacea]MBK1724292.1 hypothetical protein [Thiocystis violacea]
MINHRSLWASTAALSLLLISGVTTPSLGRAAESSLTETETVEIRADEEQRLASLDTSYAKQQRQLAEQYAKEAQLVAKQGGDPAPLLQAAAYFNKKADEQAAKDKTDK